MPGLKYYQVEKEKYNDSYNQYLTQKNALIIIKKLCKTFKLKNVLYNGGIHFNGHGYRAFVRYHKGVGRCSLHLPRKDISLGLLVHELAHILDFRLRGKGGHNKKHKMSVKKIHTICRMRHYAEKYCVDKKISIEVNLDFDDDVIKAVLPPIKKNG